MSVQHIVDGVMSALGWMVLGAALMLLYKVRVAIKTPERVLIEKVCVTANGQEYCKPF